MIDDTVVFIARHKTASEYKVHGKVVCVNDNGSTHSVDGPVTREDAKAIMSHEVKMYSEYLAWFEDRRRYNVACGACIGWADPDAFTFVIELPPE